MTSTSSVNINVSKLAFSEYDENEFTIPCQIGKGSFSIVYHANHQKLGDVAIKVLKDYVTKEDFREAILLFEKGQHPHIIQIIGILKPKKTRFSTSPVYNGIVMEFMEMGSLEKIIHDHSREYESKQVYRWIYFISNGLNYLHEEGIIHRNIKPSGILLGKSLDDLRISSFGLARLLDTESSLTTGTGTMAYMAPEILRKQSYSKPADIYSLAITIWEIVNRSKSYYQFSLSEFISQVLTGRRPEIVTENSLKWFFSLVSDVENREIQELLNKGWDDDPVKRPIARDFLDFSRRMVENSMGNQLEELEHVVLFGQTIGQGEYSLIIDQLERASLVDKANEETKKMMERIAVQLENVSLELEFHYSALILGGWNDTLTDSICIFDSKDKKWRTCKQKLPFRVAQHGSAILNDKIYFMGGYNNLYEPLASCYKLGESGEWTKMTDMNEKRTQISQSTIVFGSEIWVISGWNGRDVLKTVEKYNPEANIWTNMPASSASIVGGKIFVSGGGGGYKYLQSVELYNLVENKWEIFCDMPLELSCHCSIVEATNLIIIGGDKSDGTPSDEVWKIDVLNPNKEWIEIPSLQQGRYFHGAVKLSNRIMVFGGVIDDKTRIDSVEIFDGTSWKEGPKLPEKHGVFSSIPLSITTETQLLQQLC